MMILVHKNSGKEPKMN